jgi:hypothetical protein
VLITHICVILLNVDALLLPPLKVLLCVPHTPKCVLTLSYMWMPSSPQNWAQCSYALFEEQVGSAGALQALLCGFRAGESWSGIPNLRNDGCTVNGPPPGDLTSCLLHGRKSCGVCSNTAFLLAAYMVCCHGWTAEQADVPFAMVEPNPLQASTTPRTCPLTSLSHCLTV